MELFREFFKIIESINNSGVEYAVVGGVALAFHANPRLTKDIDILANPDDLIIYESIFTKLGYLKSASPITFKNTNMTLHRFVKPSDIIESELIIIDLLLGNEAIHREIIKRSIVDDSYIGKVSVATKSDLIMMKKIRNSQQDKADIENLESNDE